MRFSFIAQNEALHEVKLMCRLLDVSRAGFYKWRQQPVSERATRHQRLEAEIKAVHFEHKKRYGSPRIHQELRRRGVSCGRHQVAAIMRRCSIQGIVRRRKPWFQPASSHGSTKNFLQQKFNVSKPNVAWVVDFTYIQTSDGWLFLAVVLDLFSRRVVGRSTSSLADEELVLNALRQGLSLRKPLPGLLHHSDQGSVYLAARYGKMLCDNGLRPSVSRRGNCHDNAVVESFFGSMKRELFVDKQMKPRGATASLVIDYIDNYYNRKRLHSSLGFTSPVEYEMQASV